MFHKDFYPTAPEEIDILIEGLEISGKVILEPQAGKADIIKRLNQEGAKDVLFCEINYDLMEICKKPCVISRGITTMILLTYTPC